MNDTVTKLMGIADEYALRCSTAHVSIEPARQALQDELVRLFTPLTDEQLLAALPDDDTPMTLGEAWVKFARYIEVAHGITGEKNEPDKYWHLRNIPGLTVDKDGNIGVGPK